MAGINRLGKAPPRPGSLRPPDPNRNKTLDVFSEGTEGDADYMRMVRDIEDTQGGQSGWLFGRGAFDKGDLLYLRDEEEKKRFKEEELRDSERMQFLRMQASTTAGLSQDLPPSVPARAPDKAVPRPHARPVASIVRVKGGKAGSAPAKRPPAAGSAPAAALAKRPRGAETPEAVPKPTSAAQNGHKQQEIDIDEGPGLAGLVGGYGSDDDEEDDEASDDGQQQQERHATDESRGAAAERRVHERQTEQLPGIDADDTVRGPKIAEEEPVDYD
ncbi:hypothetical protein CVIRNUC_000344 [Coccomyxa viridis]|uniref:Uncharacterized protein n=1 Tax=Coccomyxa viridis TaxID=1274662 RepID=A0AAV1HSR4_9CHLO|nr:hypothetical protein CVIRNUC_000344 [Coccomyxa viridis]